MGMLMPVAGLIKVRYNGDKADIDSSFFKLHYRTTTTIFFISTILVTSYGMIGKPIDCMGDGIPGNVLNTYCWIMSTFSIPSKYRVINHTVILEYFNKRISTFLFCLPVLLESHPHQKQKEFFKCYDAFLK